MIGTRHKCACCGRVARITGEYDEGPNDHGYEYVFEGEPGTRWISTHAASIRFRRIGDDAAAVVTKLRESIDEGR